MHFKNLIFYFFVVVLNQLLSSCNEDPVDAADYSCKTLPSFIRNTGFNPAKSAFSTSDFRIMGLVLKELSTDNSLPPKKYQHPSWKKAGWLSPIQLDKFGNIYTAPAPFVNVLVNPVEKQNTIYIVKSNDGVMEEFMQLPKPDSITNRNPFGILSIAFNCKQNILYVSSVAGSTMQKEMGCLYAIDVEKKEIVDKITGNDFFGIELVVANGKLRLLCGSARNSNIYSIKIKKDGSFGSNPQIAATIEGLGLRGDDKVRKIIFNNEDAIQVKGVEFNYNLIAPTEKQETTYDFIYSPESQQWELQR